MEICDAMRLRILCENTVVRLCEGDNVTKAKYCDSDELLQLIYEFLAIVDNIKHACLKSKISITTKTMLKMPDQFEDINQRVLSFLELFKSINDESNYLQVIFFLDKLKVLKLFLDEINSHEGILNNSKESNDIDDFKLFIVNLFKILQIDHNENNFDNFVFENAVEELNFINIDKEKSSEEEIEHAQNISLELMCPTANEMIEVKADTKYFGMGEMLNPEYCIIIEITDNNESMKRIKLEIVGVIDTKSGEIINPQIAKEVNILDQNFTNYFDVKRNERKELKQSILEGLLLTRKINDKCNVNLVYVDYVKVGKDQIKENLKDAISKKYINPISNTYHILEEGVEMNLIEAIMCGIIKIIETPEEDKMNFEKFLVLHRENNDPEITELFDYERINPLNVKVINKLQESDCWNEFVRINGEMESVAESIYNDHLELDPLQCGDADKESLLLTCVNGKVSLDDVVNLLESMKGLFIGEQWGDMENLLQGKDIASKFLLLENVDKRDLFIISCDKMNIISLDKLGEEMKEDLFITRINVEDIKNKLKQLIELKELGLDLDENVIADKTRDTFGVFSITMMAAVMNDIMLTDTLDIKDKSDGKTYGLETSVEMRLIDGQTAEILLECSEILRVKEIINDERSIDNEICLSHMIYNKESLVNVLEPTLMNFESIENILEICENENILRELLKEDTVDLKDKSNFCSKILKEIKTENDIDYESNSIIFENIDIEEMTIQAALELGLILEDTMVQLLCSKVDNAKQVLYCGNEELVLLINEVNILIKQVQHLTSVLSIIPVVNDYPKQTDILSAEDILKCIIKEDVEIERRIEKFQESVGQFQENDHIMCLLSKTDTLNKLIDKISETMTFSDDFLSNSFKVYVANENENKFEIIEVGNVIRCSVMFGQSLPARFSTVIVGVKDPFDERVIRVEEAINDGIINVDNQTCISDPQSMKEISWMKAIDEHRIITHEIDNDMLTPDFINCLILSSVDEFIDVEAMDVIGVVDLHNGEIISIKDAENESIINLKLGIYHNVINNEWLTLKNSILQGLVLAKAKDNNCILERCFVQYVKIGKDQSQINLNEAISKKYINPICNIYHILEEGVEMNLIEAIMCGIINIIETPEEDKMNFEKFLVLHRGNNDPEIKKLLDYERINPLNVKVINKLQESYCWNEFVRVNDQMESVAESIYNDHLELDPLRCGDEDKESLLLACVNGKVSLDDVVNLLESMKGLFIGEQWEDMVNILQGKDIESKLLQLENVDKRDLFIISCDKMNIISLDKLGEEMKEDLFITRINVEDIKNKLKQLIELKELGLDISKNVIADKTRDTFGVFSITMMAAVMNDIMLLDSLEVKDKGDANIYKLEKAVEKRLIEEKTAEILLDYVDKFSFDKLINDGRFNIDTNYFDDELSLLKAIDEEMIDPKLVYVVIPQNNEIVNFSKLINTCVLNGETNTLAIETEDKYLKIIKLSEINNGSGIIMGKVDVLERKQMFPKSLKDITLENNLNYEVDKILFDDIEVDEMTINNAIKIGLLCEKSSVRLFDYESKEVNKIIYCDNPLLIILINDVNKLIDNIDTYISNILSQKSKDLNSDLEIDNWIKENDQILLDLIIDFNNAEEKLNYLLSIENDDINGQHNSQLNYTKDKYLKIKNRFNEQTFPVDIDAETINRKNQKLVSKKGEVFTFCGCSSYCIPFLFLLFIILCLCKLHSLDLFNDFANNSV